MILFGRKWFFMLFSYAWSAAWDKKGVRILKLLLWSFRHNADKSGLAKLHKILHLNINRRYSVFLLNGHNKAAVKLMLHLILSMRMALGG